MLVAVDNSLLTGSVRLQYHDRRTGARPAHRRRSSFLLARPFR